MHRTEKAKFINTENVSAIGISFSPLSVHFLYNLCVLGLWPPFLLGAYSNTIILIFLSKEKKNMLVATY